MRPSSESLSVRRREAGRAEVKAVGRCRAVTGLNPTTNAAEPLTRIRMRDALGRRRRQICDTSHVSVSISVSISGSI